MRGIIARKIAGWTIKYSPLEEEREEKVICYGLEKFLEITGITLVFILIGIRVGKGGETLTALTGFSVLRSQAGGIHCTEKWQCRSCMGIVILSSVYIPEIVVVSLPVRSLVYLAIVVVLYMKAPVNGKKIKFAYIQHKQHVISIM